MIRNVATNVAIGIAIMGIALLGWGVVIRLEPQAWSSVVSEKSAWMSALGTSSFIALCAVAFNWTKLALITDSRGILSDYGVELDCLEMPPPYTTGQLVPFALVGALWSVSLVFFGPWLVAFREELGAENPYLLYVYLMNTIAATLAWVAGAAEMYCTRALGKLLRRAVRPNLLEPVASQALLRRGYRTAAFFFLLIGSVSLLWAAGTADAAGGVAFLILAMLLVAMDFSYPALVLRSLTREAKRLELAKVASEIRAERAAPSRQVGTDAEDARLSNLVSYRQMIAATSEWPLEISGFARVAIAILLGLSSWLAAALVERLLDRIL
jgi:hypothetical protein